MSMRIRAIEITGQGRLTQLISQNKLIRIWHRQMAHISNIQVVRILKLVNSIYLALADKEYNPAEILIDFKDSNIFDNKIANFQSPIDINSPPIIITFAY